MSTKLGKIVADFNTTLATAIAIGGTSLTLQSIVDDDGINIPDGNYYFTIDGNNSSKEHIFCTIVGASVTSILSVSRQGVTASGVVRAHRVGAQVVITDFAHIARMNDLFQGTTKLNASTPLEYDATASITLLNQLATKAYVDGIAIAGSPDSTTTTKGIVKMSVAPASPTSPIAVGDNDPRVPTAAQVGYIPTSAQKDALAGTGTPSGSNKYVTADTNALNELLSNKSTDGALGSSNTLYPTQNAVKSYVDTKIAANNQKNSGTTTGTLISDTTTTDTVITHGLSVVPKIINVICKGLAGSSSFGFASTDGVSTITAQNDIATLRNGTGISEINAGKIASSNFSGSTHATITAISSTTFTITFASAAFSGNAGIPVFVWEVIG